MPRLKNRLPSYRRHKQSGQAIVTLSGQDFLLGPFGTQASRREYDRIVAEWLGRGRQPLVETDAGLDIAELSARYWAYATAKYVRRGKRTAEQFKVKTALQHLLRLYENSLAADFAPVHLKVVRQAMIDSGWARKYVNQQVGVLVRMFKWAAVEGLLPPSIHASLALVDGIRRGETTARRLQRCGQFMILLLQPRCPISRQPCEPWSSCNAQRVQGRAKFAFCGRVTLTAVAPAFGNFVPCSTKEKFMIVSVASTLAVVVRTFCGPTSYDRPMRFASRLRRP